MPNQAYRLRIRNAVDNANALVITSIAGGTNPYIAAPPSGDGQEVDLLTGAVRTGAYVVEVVDAVTGTDAVGTIRVVTNQLYDGVEEYLLLENGDKILLESGDPIELEGNNAEFGRPHLLSRKAFVEMSSNGGSTWDVWCAGYLTSVRQVDAIRYAFTVSNTRRIEQTKQVFTWQTQAERDAFPQRGCIFGGPIIDGLKGGPTRGIDSGGWEYKYKATTGAATPSEGDTLALRYDFGYFYPLFERKQVPGPDQNAQWWRSVRPYLKQVSGDASAAGAEFSYLRGDQVFALPDLTAIITNPATGDEWLGSVRAINVGPSMAVASSSRYQFQQRTNIYVTLYRPDTSWPALPAADTTLRVRVVTRQISEASPLYIQAHPADIAKELYELINLTVNTTAYDTVKQALGENLMVTYRLTAAQTMAEFLEQSLFGPFGFAARIGSSGEVEFFSTRVLNATAPTYTVNDADIVGDTPPPIYDLDEATVVTGFTLTQTVLTNGTELDTNEGDPKPDGIYATEQTLEYANADTSTFSTRVVSYTVPGMVTDAESFVPTFEAWSRGVVYEGFERFGRGAVNSELPVIRTSAAAAAQIGDLLYINAGYYPNKNYRIGESSVGARVAQIVRREERPEAVVFKLVDAGTFVQPAIAAAVTLAVSTSDPRRVAQFTITNAGALNNTAEIAVAVEWARGASPPASGVNGNLFTRYEPGEIPTGPVALPGVRLGGQTVYVRVRSEQAGIFPSAWTGWQSVTLNAWTAPTGVTVGTLTNETAAVSWNLNGNTVDPVDVYVAPGSVAPSDWTPYRVNTLPEGTTSTLLTGLSASTPYIVGVAFRDRVANVAMTPVTATFTTAGTTTGTADVPAGLVIVDGVNDVNVPQGVVLGLYASVGASSIVIERAPNLTSGATDYPGTYAELAVVPATAETYVDYLPKDGTKYWYRIKHRTPGKVDSNPVPQRLFISVGSTVYAGLQAVATGVPSSITRPSAAPAIITPTSLYDEAGPFLKQLLVRLQYTDVQSRIVYYEYRSRERIKKTWGAWTAWSGALYPRTDLTYMQAEVTLNNTSYIYEVEWRVYGADGEGNLSFIRLGTTEWPQNYGQNKPIIKVQKQGYNAGTAKYEVWWRFYFDRGNSTLDEDGDDNTQQTFTTQVIAASVKDQSGTTATNVVTSGTKTVDGWKATWDSTASQAWVYEISVDTAMPTQYYLQYQDTDVLDEQLVAPTSGQTFTGPAAGTAGSGDVVGDDTSTTVQNIVAYNTTGGKNITELTGTQGDVLYHNGTSWVKLPAGTSGYFLKTNGAGANPAWAASGSLTDGDKGDITVSGSGTVWTIDNGVVSTSKMGGDVTTAGKALLDDVDAAAQRTTLGLGTLATQSGTFSGTSSGTNTGDVILSGTPDYITIAGQTITRGLIDLTTDVTGDLPFSNLAQVASDTLLGRSAAGTGDVTTITCTAAGRNLLDDPDTTVQRATLGLGTLATQSSVDLSTQVTGDLPFSNMPQIAGDTVLGRNSAATGDIESITCTAAGRALLDDVDATAQRTTLGLGTLATQSGTFSGSSSGTNTGDVTLAGTPDYITISGQTITRGLIDLATDVTGALPYANGGTGNTSVPTANSGDYVLVYDSSTGVAKVINVNGTGTDKFLRYSGGDVLFDTPPNFTSGAAGYAPASGGGTTNFLRADGTWTTPTVGSVSANNVTAGTFPGATYTFSDSLTVTSDLTVDTNLIKTDSTNNRVGINQTTPLYALDVTGTARVTGTTTFNGLTYTWPASQTANYYLQTNGSGTLSWATVSGSDPWTYQKLTSDYTTTSATLATISVGGVSLEFTPAANTHYEFEGVLMLRTSTATNNPRTGIAWPTGMTDGVVFMNQTGAAATTGVYTAGNIAATVQVAVGGLPNNTQSWPCFIKGVMTAGATPGSTFRVQMAAETAGGTMTVETGSFLKYRTI